MFELPQLITAAVIGIVASYLTFRLSSARADGRDSQWRSDCERRITLLEKVSLESVEIRALNAVRLEGISHQLSYLLKTVGEDGDHGLRGGMHAMRNEWTPILTRLQTLMEARDAYMARSPDR